MLRNIIVTTLLALSCSWSMAQTNDQPKAAQPPAWVLKFNELPEATRRHYISEFTKAEQLFAQKSPVEALHILQELEPTFTENPGLYNLIGACFIEMRDVPRAIENFQKSFEMDPKNSTVEFNLAEAYFVQHEYKEALKRFTTLLEQTDQKKDSPTYQILQFKRLICAYKLQDEALITKLADLYDPMDDSPYFYYAQALACFNKKEKTEAESNIKAAINIYNQTNILKIFQDSLIETGYLPSILGQTFTPELKAPAKEANSEKQ